MIYLVGVSPDGCGIEVAKLVDLPQKVIDVASDIRNSIIVFFWILYLYNNLFAQKEVCQIKMIT